MPAAQLTFKRYETKYLLDPDQRAVVLALVEKNMRPDEHGPATVRNVYYDTPTALLARRSAERPVYKEKLRTRCYGAPHPFDPVFVELKKKFEGVVYKRRCQLPPADAEELLRGRGRPQTQVEREIDWTARSYEGLAPMAYLAYDRLAFFSPADRDLRVTLDDGVRVRWEDVSLFGADEGRPVLPFGATILEVKTMGGMPAWLVAELSRLGVRKAGVSKYGRAWELRGVDTVLPQAGLAKQGAWAAEVSGSPPIVGIA